MVNNNLDLKEKIKEFIDESGYSTLEETEEWLKTKMKKRIPKPTQKALH